MTEPRTPPRYAAELARIAMFTVQRVQAKITSISTPIPSRETVDEKDFEEAFELYVERIRLESQVAVYRDLSFFREAVSCVNDLQDVNSKIKEWETKHHLAVRF